MRAVVSVRRRGFTLVEVLVTIAIVVVLVALFGGAVSAARTNAQDLATRGAIGRLDQVITTQFRRYETRSVPPDRIATLRNQGIAGASAARAWEIRRTMITADMPDRWSDVAFMAGDAANFPKTAAQAAYIATWRATNPSSAFGGAECLFMIVMQGGIADCLDCNGLAQLKKGDKDGDGALEFWDDWNNPIDYLLWAPALQQRGDGRAFFSPLDAAFPATGSVRPGLGMKPLIYSAGPDGKYGLNRNPGGTNPATAEQNVANTATLDAGTSPTGRDCGNPASATGGPVGGDSDDNVLNVEVQATL